MANVGEIVYQVQMDVAQLLTSQRQLDQRLRNMEGGFDRTTRSINDTENAMFSLSKAAALVTSALSAGAIIHAVDEWGQMAARIKMALNSVEGDVERYSEIQERFLEVSNRNGKAIETVQALYAGSATSMKELGYNTTQTVDYIESLSSAFTANATGAQQTESAMTALNRAMVVGVLKGNDWHSVLNATPSIVNDIAKELSRLRGGMKVTENDVKKMAMEGGISMQIFANAMIAARKENNALADSMDNTVADGFTKLANSAKAYYGELNQAYGVTRTMSAAFADITANFDTFANIANVVALVVGARLVGAFSASIKTKILDAAASVKQAQANAATAKAAEYAATAERRKSLADKESTASAVALAQAEYNVARGSSAEAMALDNLNAKKTIARNASIAYAQSLTAEAAASQAATIAARNASAVMGVLRGGLALIGGPMGAAMLAGAAIMYFSESSKQAKQDASDFADSLDELNGKLKEMSFNALNGAIGKTTENIEVQEGAVKDLKDEIADLNSEYDNATRKNFSMAGAEKDREKILNKIKIKTAELEVATNKLNDMQSFLAQATAEVNARVSESEKIFGGATDGASKLANMVQWLAGQMRSAADEQDNLNSKLANQGFRSEEGDKYIQQLKEQNELLSITDKRERAIAAERQRQLKAGTLADSEQMKDALSLIGANYDLAEAERERDSTGKKSASDALKSAKAVADALKNQQAAVDRLNQGYKEGSVELAKYDAAKALGDDATPAQIAQAEKLAAEKFAIEQRSADQKAALDANVLAKAKQTRDDDLAQLERQLKDKLIEDEQYHKRRAEIAEEYSNKISSETSKNAVNFVAENRAQIDPVQALANENAKKLALMESYQKAEQALLQQSYQDGQLSYDQYIAAKQNTDAQYLALKTAQDKQYQEQQIAAQWQLLSQQSLGYDMLTSAVDSLSGNASNAITGLITQTMSWSDAARSLGNTMLNSVVNSIVQVGVEMAKNFILGQTLGVATQAANASAAVAGGAAALAAWTPAAIAASIATMGAASASGLGAYTAAQATGAATSIGMKALTIAGARKDGGPVSAGEMYRVGEGGKPEIFKASNGNQYMIPGDNGKVISNRDIGGGQVPVTVNINDYSSGGNRIDAQARQDSNGITIDAFITDMDNKGPMHSAITRNTTASARVR
ncbi:tape measure protein [Morganella morganii]|uniref:tape measure protein n=1 Tax=Morganella morganii TaxID=582 RepID=UPI0034DD51E1